MNTEYKNLSISNIKLDEQNPRIKKALEKYGDEINAERIYFALRSADDKENSSSSFSKLAGSINAYGDITQPITVQKRGEQYICIDGNTRLAIFKDFAKKKSDGNWDSIRALVMDNPTKKEIDSVRISAHLVGARPWPAYEKARYLNHLHHEEFKDFDEMIALCGGNKNEIERQIDAYEDMNEYYRDKITNGTSFQIDRFSGFVELQKSGIKDSIFEAGLKLENFGEWIKNGNIKALADVRQLPRVLSNPEAKQIFTEGGINSIKTAIKHIEKSRENIQSITLKNATLEQLTIATTNKLSNLTLPELQALKSQNNESNIQVSELENLFDMLQAFLDNVRK